MILSRAQTIDLARTLIGTDDSLHGTIEMIDERHFGTRELTWVRRQLFREMGIAQDENSGVWKHMKERPCNASLNQSSWE